MWARRALNSQDRWFLVRAVQAISDAYTLLIELALSGATGAAAGARTVVTSPGSWVPLAQALDEVGAGGSAVLPLCTRLRLHFTPEPLR